MPWRGLKGERKGGVVSGRLARFSPTRSMLHDALISSPSWRQWNLYYTIRSKKNFVNILFISFKRDDFFFLISFSKDVIEEGYYIINVLKFSSRLVKCIKSCKKSNLCRRRRKVDRLIWNFFFFFKNEQVLAEINLEIFALLIGRFLAIWPFQLFKKWKVFFLERYETEIYENFHCLSTSIEQIRIQKNINLDQFWFTSVPNYSIFNIPQK